jgi:hypothetical protein
MAFHGIDELASAGARHQRQWQIERENLEHVVVRTVTGRRIGQQPFGVAERILAGARRRFPFEKLAVLRRKAPDEPMAERLRAWRVGILDDDR